MREALGEVERQIEGFRADEARVRSEIGGYIQRLENAPRRQRALQEMSRDHQTTRELYDGLRKRYEQAQLDEGAQTGDAGPRFRILDAAVPPSGPAAPNRMLLLFFALLGAVGAAVAAASVARLHPAAGAGEHPAHEHRRRRAGAPPALRGGGRVRAAGRRRADAGLPRRGARELRPGVHAFPEPFLT
jgi:hypothetical protein